MVLLPMLMHVFQFEIVSFPTSSAARRRHSYTRWHSRATSIIVAFTFAIRILSAHVVVPMQSIGLGRCLLEKILIFCSILNCPSLLDFTPTLLGTSRCVYWLVPRLRGYCTTSFPSSHKVLICVFVNPGMKRCFSSRCRS